MSKITEVAINDRRALNQAFIFARQTPPKAVREARVFIRALRSALRMSQTQLAARCGIPRAHIARIEAGKIDPQLSTVDRIFDAMFCDLIVLPRARKRPGDAMWEQGRARGFRFRRIWDEKPYWPPASNLGK